MTTDTNEGEIVDDLQRFRFVGNFKKSRIAQTPKFCLSESTLPPSKRFLAHSLRNTDLKRS